MICGFSHCGYKTIKELLEIKIQANTIKKLFDITVGDPQTESTTLEDTPLSQIELQKGSLKEICKAALTNLVFENFKRTLQGQSLIPILFCLDIQENSFPLTPEALTSKEARFNRLITYSEMRRCYKLCETLKDHPICQSRLGIA